MNFNFLGISFVGDDVPHDKAKRVEDKMNEIIDKYRALAQEEFDAYLQTEGLESAMGVVTTSVFKAWNEHSTPGDVPTIFEPIENNDRPVGKYRINIAIEIRAGEIMAMMQKFANNTILAGHRVDSHFDNNDIVRIIAAYNEVYGQSLSDRLVTQYTYERTIWEFAMDLAKKMVIE